MSRCSAQAMPSNTAFEALRASPRSSRVVLDRDAGEERYFTDVAPAPAVCRGSLGGDPGSPGGEELRISPRTPFLLPTFRGYGG
jgi:hypothetical protein